MIYLVHQRAEPHTVAEQNELVLVLGALLAGAGEELDCGRPFFMRDLRLPGERVQVGYECSYELEGTGLFA